MELLARRGLNIAAVLLSLLLHAALLFAADRLIGVFGNSSSSNAGLGGKITLVAMAPARPQGNTVIANAETREPPQGSEPVFSNAEQEIEDASENFPPGDVPQLPESGTGQAAGVSSGDHLASSDSGNSVQESASVSRIAPKPLEEIQPGYPFKSRKLGHEGRVVLELLISTDGMPLVCNVAVSSGWPELDDEARRTVLESRFSPAREEGEPVQETLKLSVVFSLNG